MTKVDERAVVPRIDAAANARLTDALDQREVVSAFLFGSQAAGTAGPLSDVDVAVWLDPTLDRGEQLNVHLRLMEAASQALGTDEVDVVLLNDATPVLRHRVMRDGVRLLDRDPPVRIRLETAALLEYLDTAPLRATLTAGVKSRLRDGHFGRR